MATRKRNATTIRLSQGLLQAGRDLAMLEGGFDGSQTDLRRVRIVQMLAHLNAHRKDLVNNETRTELDRALLKARSLGLFR